jgi:3-hydroxymyristoyl/3-hydroxydecanoyl-(acyl carrier protein) dehydratase
VIAFDLSGSAEGSDRWTGHVAIPRDLAYFTGHFPRRPLLPGVAQIALAAQAIERWRGPGAVTGLQGLRFRRPVEPGAALTVTLALAGEPHAVRFSLAEGSERVCDGVIVVAPPAPSLVVSLEDPPAWPEMETPRLRLPHAGPALLVRGVVGRASSETTCLASIPESSPFAAGGFAPGFLAVEAAAQAAALVEPEDDGDRGEPGAREGYLVGIRHFDLPLRTLPVDTPLEVEIRDAGQAPPLRLYAATVRLGSALAAAGTFGTFVESEAPR